MEFVKMNRGTPAWLLRKYTNQIIERLVPMRKTEIDGLKFFYLAGDSGPQDPREFSSKGLEFHQRIDSLSGSEAIDVGANIGSYTLRLATRFHRVTAFEPSPVHCKVLRHNITLNGLRNVNVREVALSDFDGVSPLYLRRGGATSLDASHYGLTYDKVNLVRTRKLDDYQSEFTKLDLIKIDAENLEYRILKGAVEMISTFRPVLAVEVHGVRVLVSGSCRCEVCGLLRGYGYDVEVTGELSSVGMVHWVWATPIF